MNNRTQRLLAIKKVLLEQQISSQEVLLQELNLIGIEVTQATLSRDLKALKVVKQTTPDGGYVYRLMDEQHSNDLSSEITKVNFLADGFVSIAFSNNLGVIKTLPGYASSIAAVLDQSQPYEIIGTIAGDDTILLITREGVGHNDVKNALILIMPRLKDKIEGV